MESTGQSDPVRICCGPRCGAWPGQRAIYRAIETCVAGDVRPTMCRGHCGQGVTVVCSNGEIVKIASAGEVQKLTQPLNEDSK